MVDQNNHYIITALVGLDAVEAGRAELSPTFRTKWAPRNLVSSARRSRHFALKAALTWVMDGVESYGVTTQALLGAPFGPTRQEVEPSAMLSRLAKETGQEASTEHALVQVFMAWRDQLTHRQGSQPLDGRWLTSLTPYTAQVAGNYQGLDLGATTERLKKRASPSFKEVAAAVRSAELLVKRIDEAVLGRIDPTDFLHQALADYLLQDGTSPSAIRGRSGRIWSSTPDRQLSMIMQIACSSGMTQDGVRAGTYVSEEYLRTLVGLTPMQAAEHVFGERDRG